MKIDLVILWQIAFIHFEDTEIDYKQVDNTLELLRKNSLSYLVGQCIAV